MNAGRIFEIDGEQWVVSQAHRTRAILKLAESEWHAIRLSLGLTQAQMAKKLKIKQPFLCKLEKGVCRVSDALAGKMREMKSQSKIVWRLQNNFAQTGRLAHAIKDGAALCGRIAGPWVVSMESALKCPDCLKMVKAKP